MVKKLDLRYNIPDRKHLSVLLGDNIVQLLRSYLYLNFPGKMLPLHLTCNRFTLQTR